jgi:hypothetical protein
MKEMAVACSSSAASIALSSDASKVVERRGKWRGEGSGEEREVERRGRGE